MTPGAAKNATGSRTIACPTRWRWPPVSCFRLRSSSGRGQGSPTASRTRSTRALQNRLTSPELPQNR